MKVQGIEVPPWIDIAEGEIGVRERRGRRHHPRILQYHSTVSLAAERDEVPWCSSFVNWVMEEAGYEGTDSALARSWTFWGVPCSPRFGAVTVLKRRVRGHDLATGSRSGFHVGFYCRSNDRFIRLLGGNQRDGVRFSNYPKRRYDVVDYRWPEGHPDEK